MKLLPLLPLLFLMACATVPQNFDERLAAAYTTNTSIRYTAASALNSGRINEAEASNVLELTDRVRAVLDESSDGDERGLDLAIEILERLERFLE